MTAFTLLHTRRCSTRGPRGRWRQGGRVQAPASVGDTVGLRRVGVGWGKPVRRHSWRGSRPALRGCPQAPCHTQDVSRACGEASASRVVEVAGGVAGRWGRGNPWLPPALPPLATRSPHGVPCTQVCADPLWPLPSASRTFLSQLPRWGGQGPALHITA